MRFFSTLLFLLGAAICMDAQTTPSVDDVLKHHYNAIGKELIDDISSVIIEKDIVAGNYKAQQEVFVLLDSSILARTESFGQTIIACLDGTSDDQWQINPFMSTSTAPIDLDANSAMQLRLQMSVFGPLYHLDKTTKVAIKETKASKKKPVLVLTITYDNGFTEDLYLNGETYLLEKVKNKLGTTYFGDYTTQDGISLPGYAEINSTQGTMTIKTTSIRFNDPKIQAVDFARPSK